MLTVRLGNYQRAQCSNTGFWARRPSRHIGQIGRRANILHTVGAAGTEELMAMNIPSFFFFVSAILFHQVTCDVDKKWMLKTLTEYFAAPRHFALENDFKYKKAAMTFIRDEFREIGLETHIHTFSTKILNVTGVNVVGLLKGRYFNTPDDSVVGVAAHYDTVRPSPGVNDNGAAMVAMLQAARELSKHRNRNSTILFLGFDFEEAEELEDSVCPSGMCGSQTLTRQWLPNFWFKTVNCILVLDTILNFDDTKGSQNFTTNVRKLFPAMVKNVESNEGRGDFLMVTGRGHEAPLVTLFKDTWNTMGDDKYKIQSIVLPSSVPNPATEKALIPFSEFVRGPHTAFWLRGDRAVYLSDTVENRGYMKNCYHSQCDNIAQVSEVKIGFIAKTVRTLISVVDKMAPAGDGTAIQSTNHFVILPALLFFRFASF